MITVNLKGGLGNQMFQYALGRHLSEKHKTELRLDLAFLLNRLPGRSFLFRNYALGIFDIQEKFTLLSKLASWNILFRDMAFPAQFLYLKARNLFDKNYWIREKEDYCFDEGVLSLPDNVYLDGYWQSYKYLEGIEDVLRKEFSSKNNFGENRELAEKIKSTSAVCVHARRADYITNPLNQDFFAAIGPDYYKKAEEVIVSRIASPIYFVFSDDIGWCRKNLKFHLPAVFVEPGSAAEDFYLMTLCRHHIICNSTFGWWAAWLNSNPGKIVIAPKNWVRDPSINTDDLIPPPWTRI